MYAQLDTYTALVTAGIRNTQPTFDYPQVFTPKFQVLPNKRKQFVLDHWDRLLERV